MLRGSGISQFDRAIREAPVGRHGLLTRTAYIFGGIGLHMCRGNLKGMWMGEGGYEPIADALFNQLNVDTFFLEYDTERAGDFAPLRHLPKGKLATLGLISAKTPVLEDKSEILGRINAAVKNAPLDQLALSPQCGFSSGGGDGQVVDMDDTRAKLELVVAIAEDVWGSA